MSLFLDGYPCRFCGQPMIWQVDLIHFQFYESLHPLVRQFDGSACHQSCLSQWSQRDEFVQAWNHEAQYFSSGLLEVTPAGKVQYLTRWGRYQYLCGWKESPLLPKPIEFWRPLLELKVVRNARRYSPLWRITKFGIFSGNVQPEALGLPPTLAADVRAWGQRFEPLCQEFESQWQKRENDSPPKTFWQLFDAEGHRLWKRLQQELRNRYRVVYLMGRTIFEPEREEDLNLDLDVA